MNDEIDVLSFKPQGAIDPFYLNLSGNRRPDGLISFPGVSTGVSLPRSHHDMTSEPQYRRSRYTADRQQATSRAWKPIQQPEIVYRYGGLPNRNGYILRSRLEAYLAWLCRGRFGFHVGKLPRTAIDTKGPSPAQPRRSHGISQ